MVWSDMSPGGGTKKVVFRPDSDIFQNSEKKTIPIRQVEVPAGDAAAAAVFATNNGQHHFCRAAVFDSTRPGGTSWGIVDALSDSDVQCGCSGAEWSGRGYFYGGFSEDCTTTEAVCGCDGGNFAAEESLFSQCVSSSAWFRACFTRVRVSRACTAK